MDFTIKTLTALAALLMAVPGASALAASTDAPLPTFLPNASEIAAGAQDNLRPTSDAAVGAIDGIVAVPQGVAGELASTLSSQLNAVPDVLACRAAVHVHVDWFGGKVTNTRDGADSFLVPYTFVSQTTQQVPHYETVTKTVVQTISILDGILPPVTQTVTEIVGYDTKTVLTESRADLAVAAVWRDDYVAWTAHHGDWYVSPLAALPAIDGLTSDPVAVLCGSDTQVYSQIPTPWSDGSDLYCLCGTMPADGWYTRILSLDVRLAAAPDYQQAWANGTIVAPQDIVDTAIAKAQAMHITADHVAQQAQERATAGHPDASTSAPGPAATTQSKLCSTLNVPMSTGIVLGLLGATILSVLAIAANRIVRRKAA